MKTKISTLIIFFVITISNSFASIPNDFPFEFNSKPSKIIHSWSTDEDINFVTYDPCESNYGMTVLKNLIRAYENKNMKEKAWAWVEFRKVFNFRGRIVTKIVFIDCDGKRIEFSRDE